MAGGVPQLIVEDHQDIVVDIGPDLGLPMTGDGLLHHHTGVEEVQHVEQVLLHMGVDVLDLIHDLPLEDTGQRQQEMKSLITRRL